MNDEERAKLIIAAAKTSMGYTISEFDIKGLTRFAERVVHLAEYREDLADYLHDKYAALFGLRSVAKLTEDDGHCA